MGMPSLGLLDVIIEATIRIACYRHVLRSYQDLSVDS